MAMAPIRNSCLELRPVCPEGLEDVEEALAGNREARVDAAGDQRLDQGLAPVHRDAPLTVTRRVSGVLVIRANLAESAGGGNAPGCRTGPGGRYSVTP